MAELIQIKEPENMKASRPQWKAFLELGFRPLYLGGCFWAAVSIALWVYAPHLLNGPLNGVIWHAHEMLWGFIATIAVGFLFTASSNWTGVNPLYGLGLGALSGLWLLARIGYLLPGIEIFWLAACSELAFFAWAAIVLGKVIYSTRSRRNFGVPLLVLALGVTDAFYLLAALQGDYVLLMQRFNSGLLCMAVIALLISRRVIPFFAMRAITGLNIPMHTGSGQWQLAASGLAAILSFLPVSASWVIAITLAIASGIALAQILAWKPMAVRNKPLIWILYIGYAALGIGLLVAAAHVLGWITRAAWPVHVIGVAGFSVLIIGMVTRTALGHLGRPLQTDYSMVAAYIFVLVASALRLLALLPTAFTSGILRTAAAAWIMAFALYLWRFFPMMIRPRIDQAPLKTVQQPVMPPRKS